MLRSGRSRALILAATVALLTTAGYARMRPLGHGGVMTAIEGLETGQYMWMPELAPDGPMLVVVNIATQRLIAYRNGVPVGVSTVSTGKAGHRTPLGVFTVLQKAVHHRSNIYSGAPMPYMQRLTWQGIAMHGGSLPGYPASHGCIRLPHSFAPLLFGQTKLGMTVVIVDQPSDLQLAPAPRTIGVSAPGPTVWRPDLSPTGPVSIVVSAADRRMVVLRNGVEIGSAPVAFDGVVDRVQAYVLRDMRDGEYRWAKVPLPGQAAQRAPSDALVPAARGTQESDPFRRALASVVEPGTTMVVLPDTLGTHDSLPPRQLTRLDSEPGMARWRSDARLSLGLPPG